MDRSLLHKSKKPRFYIVDGNGYIYRAFFALPKMNNSKGMPTNAVYGFTNMLRKLLNEEKPDYLAVAFDAKEKTFRHDSYEAYKIDRPQMAEDLQQQIPYIRKICEVLSIPVIMKSGYEADDVIATLMEQVKEQKMVGVIVASDKDLLQLVEDAREIYALDPMRDYFVYDEQAVQDKWGVKPDHIIEVLSIMGDSIDNIPGVKGIGPKGAVELIQKFDTVENLLANVDRIEKKSHRQKIEEFKDDLILSKKLIQLRKDVPIDTRIQDLKAGKPNVQAARELFLELEFYSILNEYLTNSADRATGYQVVDSEQALDQMIKKLSDSKRIALCVEADTPISFRGNIIGISFTNKVKSGWYIPLGHRGLSNDGQLGEKVVLQRLKPLLESETIEKTAYNLKRQILVLRDHGIELRGGKYDPMLMSYVLNPTRHAHKLEDLAKEYLQYQTKTLKGMVGSGQKQIAMPDVEIRALCDYCCENVDLVFEITDLLEKDLQKDALDSFYFDLELPVTGVLADVEWNGVKIDTNTLTRLSQEMGKNLDRTVAEIYEIAGGEFNINSPKQIGEVLFQKLKLPMVKKTRKTKDFSTSVEVLEELAKEYDLPQKILDYRQFSKLKSTYVDALPLMIDPKTSRVHTNYQQTVAATGRLSSTDPNLQNIPIRTPWGRLIRDAFIAEKGNVLISADYSQIELRVMAHLSADQTLIDSFLKNEDIHARTASEVFDVPMDKMTKDIRNRAKAINYGINYGQSPFGLAQLLGIDQKEAKDYIDRYFEKYYRVKDYLEQTIEFVKERGYVTTMFGRRRYIPEIRSRDRNVFLAAQRAAVNTPLQGTAADIIKLAMIEVQKEIDSAELNTKMIMQVHDELVFEVPENEKERAAKMIKEKMEGVTRLAVPLTVDLSIGNNWREAK
jgi:DNA polymerase-1